MRLLNVDSRELVEFYGDDIPSYAILSHTWGKEEVTFQDLAKDGYREKRGYAKIEGCCRQAKRDLINWVWVDTCCIDKGSSAELSEAINSMFRWYERSKVCYAYLEDVPSGQNPFESGSAFQMSRWFTRGWTLQELLAPTRIVFYDADWKAVFSSQVVNTAKDTVHGEAHMPAWVANRNKYIGLLSGITTISRKVLNREIPLASVSAACKFSWAAPRVTTRVEDMAYCLLGLLGVNMPLLYGEGEKAFIRLQEIVLSTTEDISILAWGYDLTWKVTKNETEATVLARSPAAFLGYPKGNYRHFRRMPRTHTTMTGHGLHIELLMLLIDKANRVWLGIVEEYAGGHDQGNQAGLAIVLRQREQENAHIFHRAGGCPPIRSFYPGRIWRAADPRLKEIYLQDSAVTPLQIIKTDISHGLWRFIPLKRSKTRRFIASKDSKATHDGPRPTLSISLASINAAGFFISSLYPPIGQGHEITRRAQVLPSSNAIETLNCIGPQNTTFYSIFASDRENRFAMRVNVQWAGKAQTFYNMSFCKLNGIHGTALERFWNTRIGGRLPPGKWVPLWQPSINLWNPSTSEAGHIRAGLQSSFVCSLDWVDGHYVETGAETSSAVANGRK